MDWNSDSYRNNFVHDLLNIADTDVNEMMDVLYATLLVNAEEIFGSNTRPKEEVRSSMDQIIKWYADNEMYERCHELKKVKERCLK